MLSPQELDSRGSTGAIYWEGLSELLDERGQRVGLGYLEMTGYAARLLEGGDAGVGAVVEQGRHAARRLLVQVGEAVAAGRGRGVEDALQVDVDTVVVDELPVVEHAWLAQ